MVTPTIVQRSSSHLGCGGDNKDGRQKGGWGGKQDQNQRIRDKRIRDKASVCCGPGRGTWGQACGRHTKVDAKVTKLWSLDDRNTRALMHRSYALRRNSNKI